MTFNVITDMLIFVLAVDFLVSYLSNFFLVLSLYNFILFELSSISFVVLFALL